ncbi:MAG TPA: F0F1 ATP synthase subunit delta [Candidatus Babeliaceae bacterium]|nr:F0F1 ATP synthase subunit delta [Candidatus Babeliaceae bacterium]
MSVTHPSLAKKYARAFMAIYGDSLTQAIIDQIKALTSYLKHHREAFFYLKLSSINDHVKEEVLQRLYNRFELSPLLNKLTHLLATHRRFFLLPIILEDIVKLYNKAHDIAEYRVSSVVPLSELQKNQIDAFIRQQTGTVPLISYNLNPKLLAGIRIQGDFVAWEQSLQKQLRAIERAFKD